MEAFVPVCVNLHQRIVSNKRIEIQTLRIVEFRVRYRLNLGAPIRRHEPAYATRLRGLCAPLNQGCEESSGLTDCIVRWC